MPRRRRAWTKEEDDYLRQWAAEGVSRHAIAVRLGRSDMGIDKRARAMNVPLNIRHRKPQSINSPQATAPVV